MKQLLIFLFSTSLFAQYFADHEAKVSLVADESHLVEVQFETYIKNLLGFESYPRTDDEVFKWKTLQLKWFKENSNYFDLPKNCKFEQSDIEFTRDEKSVVMGSILFQCSRKIKATEVDLKFFEQFPSLLSLEVTHQGELTSSKRVFKRKI